ncbi:TetR/AcrR family transcriptional regulator [Streptomyces lavendulae]|uniref:Transcriptional regulator, TetR family n=1 Tax=Streptomyces lavendulae subsp. lavendulae TaxID=58340 RepID=A0A2K8P7X2_STRLA|nr:TetR/AcrR family transcriptional regulator [Streptomyces lavendulae]ATZ22842.1 Transcriptional regulator, TetR family [Streptomyces lavendulae subsp. lavendulae]QUQ52684.1 DNA-binding transcriptional repressor TetR [Streptomyces lavendulae subsp. lavendulae]
MTSTPQVTARRSKITPEREQEFYDAVLEQLREHGYEALTMEGIAARACCGKSTLYRQWKTKPRLVAAALRASRASRGDRTLASVDTGTLAGDLREAALIAACTSGRDTRLTQALGHAVLSDEELQGALREALVEPELTAFDAIVARAVARGEIAPDHPAVEFLPAQLMGVLRIRPVLEGRYADADYLVRFVDAALLPSLGISP